MKWTRALNVGAVTLLLAPLAAIAGPVDINSASAEKISEELKGVGLSKAEAIVNLAQGRRPSRRCCCVKQKHVRT